MSRNQTSDSWAGLLLPVALIFGLVALLALDVPSGAEMVKSEPGDAAVGQIIAVAALAADGVAALVISVAVLQGLAAFVLGLADRRNGAADFLSPIRMRLGRMLVLGLEFTIASDVLRTAIAPTRQEIVILSAVILLRTLLSHFLDRENRHAEAVATAIGAGE